MTKHPEIMGCDAYEVGEAIHNMRISKGVTLEKLEEMTGIGQAQLKALQQGKTVAGSQENQVERVALALSGESLPGFMKAARAVPHLDKEVIADAIGYLAVREKKKLAEVAKQAGLSAGRLNHFVAHEDYALTLPECMRVAQLFGENTLGGLVTRADRMQCMEMDVTLAEAVSQWKPATLRPRNFRETLEAQQAEPGAHPEQITLGAQGNYERGKISTAVERLRLSRGLRNKTLADMASVSVNDLYRFESGIPAFSQAKLTRVSQALGVEDPANLVAEAEKLPGITKETVAKAIAHAAARQNSSCAQLERQAGDMRPGSLAHFVKNREKPQEHSLAIESLMPVVEVIGYSSIGALLLGEGMAAEPVESRFRSRSVPRAEVAAADRGWADVVTQLGGQKERDKGR